MFVILLDSVTNICSYIRSVCLPNIATSYLMQIHLYSKVFCVDDFDVRIPCGIDTVKRGKR